MTSCVHKMCEWIYGQTNMNFHVCLTIRPFPHLVYATSHLSFVTFYSYLVSWLTMIRACACSVYGRPRSQIWIKCDKRQMTSSVHKMRKRTYGQINMKRAITLAKIKYLGWPWSEHTHIIPISWMVGFCENYSPFHVCLTIRPFPHLVYATSHLSFVTFYSYLVSWKWLVAYTRCGNGRMIKQTWKGL
jgi:hypothetical protein